jgi:vesicle-associated membrane protein-associated protein A
MEDLPAFALDITPAVALQFTLTPGTSSNKDDTSRCTMTLTHPNKPENSKSHIAFKVKTTQPRRYLVRPNQGVVSPGKSESVTIILVEKDKQVLLQSFDRLGQSALDHSKDKFLVQSCIVPDDFAQDYISKKDSISSSGGEELAPDASKVGKALAEALTRMWNSAGSSGVEIFNKKLQVRHKVAVGTTATSTSEVKPAMTKRSNDLNPSSMTPDQMYTEITSLRRKYDELVSFSVNLTAERDILNNTLEQTKRDLSREMSSRASLENRPVGAEDGGVAVVEKKSGGGVVGLLLTLVLLVIFFLMGVKGGKSGLLDSLDDVPVVGDLMKYDLNQLPFFGEEL